MEDKQDNYISIQLYEIYGLTHELKPILPFLYQEVPIAERRNILIAYQRVFGFSVIAHQPIHSSRLLSWADSSIFSPGLREAIVYFLYIIMPVVEQEDYFDLVQPTEHQVEKLSLSYRHLRELAQSIVTNTQEYSLDCEIFNKDYIEDMYGDIFRLIDIILQQYNLKEGDIAMLKFFQNLVRFALDERGANNFLPIPIEVSYSFTRFMSVCLKQPIKILVPEFDDIRQKKALVEQVESGWMPKHLGRTPEEQLEKNQAAMAWAKARMEEIESKRNKSN